MKLLAFLIAAVILVALSLVIRVEVEFLYQRKEKKDLIEVNLKAFKGLWKFSMEIPGIDLEWENGPGLEFKETVSTVTGGKRKDKGKVGFRFWNLDFIYRIWPLIPQLLYQLQRVKQKFYRGIHCTALDWQIEIGYKDPLRTAIAAGTFWAFLGFALSRLYKQVTVKVNEPKMNVIPQFEKEGFSCNIYCIFQLRIGHIMFAGLDLFRIFQRGKRGKIYG